MNPYAIEVIEEAGIDPTAQHSKSVDSIDPDSVDLVVTLCAEEVCPLFLANAKHLHWPIPDPASPDLSIPRPSMLERFRAARDTIREKLETHEAELFN